MATQNKNSSGDEIANVNFYAVRPEATRIRTAHERYRQTTDGRAIAYSEREREFAFAKNVRLLQNSHFLNARERNRRAVESVEYKTLMDIMLVYD